MRKFLTLAAIAEMTEGKDYYYAGNANPSEREGAVLSQTLISEFWPCEIIYHYSVQDDFNDGSRMTTYLEYPSIKLDHPNLVFTIRQWRQGSKLRWSVYCDSIRDLVHVDIDHRKKTYSDVIEPNTMGVLTTKKIQSWIDYHTEIYNRLAVENEANKAMKEQFIQDIENEGIVIHWHSDKTRGWFDRGGLEFSFEISTASVHSRIKIATRTGSDFKTFLALSNNQFQSLKKVQA